MRTKYPLLGWIAVAVAGTVPAAHADDAPLDVSKGVVIRNATVVNTRDGSLAPGRTIVISDGKIQRIAAPSAIRAGGAAQVIDGTGKFVVPGFNDMHSHSMGYADKQPTVWPLLIANGVTGVREMSGTADLIAAARKLNQDSAAGLADAPEILLTTGPIFRRHQHACPRRHAGAGSQGDAVGLRQDVPGQPRQRGGGL